ncbi:putative Ig domain-containing protein [Novispirillum sp. DQ9]|uniref:putative Ig domain-containing protein n=1 Tax=Novispirillum sp. DQ9 TaxID=3398612 RepID=UPI003C7D6CD8
MMFDGAALVDAVDAMPADSDAAATTDAGDANRDVTRDARDSTAPVPAAALVRPPQPALNDGRREVVFIDASLPDRDALLKGVTPGMEVRLIGGGNQGLEQIAAWAKGRTGYDAIHIISSGASGALKLGTDVVNGDSLDSARTQDRLTRIGGVLKGDGDLLLYGCDVALGTAGKDFIQRIADITGADVAASTDTTGAATFGGNWVLEANVGSIETSSIAAAQWNGFLDAVTLIRNGTSTSYVTIQDAVDDAQNGDTVSVSAGTFVEQVTITRNITLVGAGRDSTIIRAPLTTDLSQSGGDWRNLKNQDVYAVVGVKTDSAGTVTLRDLTVDGFNQGNLMDPLDTRRADPNNWTFQGIGVYDSTVTIDNVVVTRVRTLASDYIDSGTGLPHAVPPGYTPEEQPAGYNHNEAIFAESAAGAGPNTLIVTNSYIDRFQKTAILAWGPTLTVDINNNVIQGYGGTLWSTGNAIQIASSDRSGWGGTNGDRRGTTGSVTNNQILDLGVVIPEPGQPGSYLNLGMFGPSGVLLWQAGADFVISGNTITGVFTPSWHASSTSSDGGFGNQGIDIVLSDNVVVSGNTIRGFDVAIIEEWANAGSSIAVSGNVLSDNTIDLWTAGGDDTIALTASAERITFLDSDNGVDLLDGFGVGDRIYVMSFQTGVVNGLLGGVPVIDFTGGTVTAGDGSSVAAGSVQVAVSNGVTTLYVDTDGVQDAAELEIRLNGVYSTANFALSGGDISYVNTAPTLTAGATQSLGTTTEDAASGGTVVSTIAAAAGHGDFGAGIQRSIAITGVTGRGTWQYSADGVTWVNFGAVSSSAALLLRATDHIRYVPDGISGETPSLSFRAWDETAGVAHTKVAIGATGGSTAYSTQTASATLSVTNVNDAPTAGVIGGRAFSGSGAWTFQVPANAFTDVDGDALTFAATLANGAPLPAWLVFNAATRTFSGNPPNGVGALDLRVTASDGNGGTGSATFRLSIANANDAPVARPLPAQSFSGGGAWSYQVPANTFSDADGDVLTYTATLANGRPLPGWLSFDAATGTFSGNPPNGVGALDLRVTASDGNGGTGSATFRLSIANANDAPVARPLPAQSFSGGGAWSYQVPANTFSDADGDVLTYTATLANGRPLPGWLSFDAATGTFSGNPPNGVGPLDLRVTASDGNGGSSATTFTLAVARPNDAPTVAAPVPDQSFGGSGGWTFQVPSGTFADGDLLGLTASMANGEPLPAWLRFDAASGTFSGNPPAGVGSLDLRVTAGDGQGGMIATAFRATFADTNDAPTRGAAPLPQVQWGGTFNSTTIPATAFADVDAGDSSTLSASGMPSWMSFDPATGTLSGQPPIGAHGVARVTITATDTAGASVSRTVTIVYRGAEHPAPEAPQPPAPPAPAAPPVSPGGGAGDPAPVLMPALEQTRGSDAPPPVQAGSDGAGTLPAPPPDLPRSGDASGSAGFVPARGTAGGPVTSIVEVAPPGGDDGLMLARPMEGTALAAGRSSTFQLTPGTFTHSSADAVVTIVARQADGGSLPEWIAFDAATGTFTVTPPEGLDGTVTVRVIARDEAGNEAVTEFTITIGEGGEQAPGDQVPANQQDGRAAQPAGRPGLSSQLAAAGQHGVMAEALAFLNDLLALDTPGADQGHDTHQPSDKAA